MQAAPSSPAQPAANNTSSCPCDDVVPPSGGYGSGTCADQVCHLTSCCYEQRCTCLPTMHVLQPGFVHKLRLSSMLSTSVCMPKSVLRCAATVGCMLSRLDASWEPNSGRSLRLLPADVRLLPHVRPLL